VYGGATRTDRVSRGEKSTTTSDEREGVCPFRKSSFNVTALGEVCISWRPSIVGAGKVEGSELVWGDEDKS